MEKKISVIIPNFNGLELLKRNLPQVVKQCKNCQIIIVDDASTDSSVSFINENYKSIDLIRNKKNFGFSKSVNKAVKNATGELILLLNSDVSPRKDFLKNASKLFTSKKIFAIGLADYSHEEGEVVIRGRGGAKFTKGFVNHYKLPSVRGETLWVSGGSGLFDKDKFMKLGGFDSLYLPFYWEDIDLSFRAWRSGWKCIFEPKSKVDHFHEIGAIKKSKSKFYIKTVSYKNQYLFVWKNINNYFLIIQHILWQPYHFIKALSSLNLAFFTGFLWAIFEIPKLVLTSYLKLSEHKKTEEEILIKFQNYKI